MTDEQTLRARINKIIASFGNNPASSDFQRGYLAALNELSAIPVTRPEPEPKDDWASSYIEDDWASYDWEDSGC